ncbi:MAG TPA: ABC transporter permease [Longimicrobiales bacterium]|nr:ABC transporter permease [Longimicrobiales bacterium]
MNVPSVVAPLEARQESARGGDVRMRRAGDVLLVVLAGEWQIERPPPRFGPIADDALSSDDARSGSVKKLGFEATGLGTWDSSLLVFLLQAEAYGAAHSLTLDTTGLPARANRLLALARTVPEREANDAPPRLSPVARLGTAGLTVWDDAVAAVAFLGAVASGFGRLLLRRARLRWRDFWVVVQSNGAGALPIVGLIALLVGVIIAFLGVVVLRRFGAGYYVSFLVGFGMLREMGALMTGIIMAGRTGAAFAAELGSMKITEEIDAYTTLGISPIDHLVLPRMLGLFVMMPLLVIYANFVGIMGGMLVAVALLDLSPTQFMGGMLSVVTLSDAVLGVVKGSIFGVIIGLAGCMKGLQTGSDAGAVGKSATSAVVMGITLIILANAVVDWLAALLQI